MGTSKLLLPFLLLHLIAAISPASAQLDLWGFPQCFDTNGNYTSNSTYKSNLDTLLKKIPSTNISYGFYNFSAGQEPDQANAIALCRGDVEIVDCHTCLNFVISNLTGSCPNQKEAIEWADNCTLRYSSRSILGGELENSPVYLSDSGTDATDIHIFVNGVQDLLRTLPNKTASGDSRLKFATGEAKLSGSQTVYALMQCTPDLLPVDCSICLNWAMGNITQLRGRTGARVLLPSCSVRYESFKFYGSADTLSSSPTSSSKGKNSSAGVSITGAGKKRSSGKVIVRIAVPVTLVALLLAASVTFLLTHKIKRPGKKSDAVTDIEISSNDFTSAESLQYDLKLLQAATNNFSDANKLGEGGFGGVYRGKLPNGQEIAVKRLSQRSSQGAREFKNEVVLVAKLQHRNLVRLLGFCLASDEKLLVYEFVPNKSLDYFLFADKQAELDWTRRYKIIRGIARGLLYLHEDSRLKIIHRDIKPSNILLDADMTPKISDFGLAKILGIDQIQGNTNRVAGTYGYMAPEYAFKGEFSESSDVYSFGVLVLEIISGQKINSFRQSQYPEHLMSYAWKKWKENEAMELVDPSLREGAYSAVEVKRCIHMGLLCVQEEIEARPSMSTVVLLLSSESVTLPVPKNPAFHSRTGRTELKFSSGEWDQSTSNSKSLPVSVNDVSITEVGPR